MIRGLISLLNSLEHHADPKAFEDIGGYTVTIPPGRSLVIKFENRQGQVEIDYPHDSSPEVAIKTLNNGDSETYLMCYAPKKEGN